jgi:hypothetical protein
MHTSTSSLAIRLAATNLLLNCLPACAACTAAS